MTLYKFGRNRRRSPKNGISVRRNRCGGSIDFRFLASLRLVEEELALLSLLFSIGQARREKVNGSSSNRGFTLFYSTLLYSILFSSLPPPHTHLSCPSDVVRIPRDPNDPVNAVLCVMFWLFPIPFLAQIFILNHWLRTILPAICALFLTISTDFPPTPISFT